MMYLSRKARAGAITVTVGAVGLFSVIGVSEAFVPPAPGTLSPLASCRNLAAASTVSIHPLNLKPSNAEDLHDKSASYSLQRGRWPQRRRLLTPLRSTDDDENSETEPPVPSDYDGRDGNNEPKSFGRGSWEGGGSSAEAGKDSGDPAMRSKLKATLIRKVATLNRGFVAQEADRANVEETIEMLELENPNPVPCSGFESQSSPIAGHWQLLYTTSLDVLSLQVNPAVTIGQIFQEIDSDGLGIKNIIELQPPFAAVTNRVVGSSLATLTVKLESEPVSDTRINLTFKRTEIQANSFFGRELDLPALGVDIPSGDKLQTILSRGKKKVANAKQKVRDLVKNKEKNTETVAAASGDDEEGVDGGDETSDSSTGIDSADVEGLGATTVAMKPYFETTYVDEELRVGRTGQGDLYVSSRTQH